MTKRKILQTLPADGWNAVYEGEGSEVFKSPLVCWALVEENEDGELYTNVVGMGGSDYVDFCDFTSNFVGYEKSNSL